jgi:hypothetical protein
LSDPSETSYRLLDLEPGASLGEVKRAWRDLTKVWHPDRFQGDARMEAKAEERLKAINDAYNQITTEFARGLRRLPADVTVAAPHSIAGGRQAVEPTGSDGTTAPSVTEPDQASNDNSKPMSLSMKCAWVYASLTFLLLAVPEWHTTHRGGPAIFGDLVAWGVDITISMVLNGAIWGWATAHVIQFCRSRLVS